VITRRFLILGTLLVSLCFGQDLAARLDQQVSAYVRQQRFNGSVLVARGGKVLFSKGYGMANAEWDIPNSPKTKFRLGSITKQFTSMAVLMLEQQGKLKVNDPVSKYMPDAPAAWEKVTIHLLLTHTSGIPSFTGFPDYLKTMVLPSPPAETLKRFKDKPLEFEPGSQFKYNNSGYVLLGYLIEKITGQSYEGLIGKSIFEPLGMKDTGYDHPERILKNRASGYSRTFGMLGNARYIDMTIPHAAGALYSTTEDLLLWDQALYTEKLLPAQALERLFTPFKDNYAYGWMVRTENNRKVIGHGGGINGFSSMIVRIPEEKLLAVALSNLETRDAGRIASELARLALGEKVELPK
jgi:CubicO group peptidase (beta-lactamase class C family)